MLSAVQAMMTGAATFLAGLRGAGRAVAAIILGALSVLAFAPVHAWPVLFLTFGALVWLLDGCHAEHARLADRLRAAAIVGFCFGFGYFLAGLYWVAEAFLVEPWRHGWLLPFVMTALPGGMALFFAAAAALAMLLWVPGPGRAFALAIAFFLAEFARGHVLTGFPWNLLGYSLLGSLPLMQLARSSASMRSASLPCSSSPHPPRSLPRRSRGSRKGAALSRSPHFSLFCLSPVMAGASAGSRRRASTTPISACASSRPISTRPRNGAPKTATRSSPTISN